MAGENKNSELGFPEEESLRGLFGEEMRDFNKDNFEGSKEEHQIFRQVFYGNNNCNASKNCTLAGIMNCETGENKHSKSLISLNCESSVLTGRSSLNGQYCEELIQKNFKDMNGDVSGSGHVQESFTKRLKLSSDGLFNYKTKEPSYCLPDISQGFLSLEPSKEVSGMYMPDWSHLAQQMPCRIVESFSLGIISSCFLPSHHEETDGPGDVDDNITLRTNSRNEFMRDGKGNGEGKSVTSPVSQESFASKHLVMGGPGTLHSNQRSDLLDSDAVDSATMRAFSRNLPSRLRSHAHHLLMDAGWRIETRRRKDMIKRDSVFKMPGEGLVISSLSKAWRACGERLLAGCISVTQEEIGRQWVDINGFWHDLSDALAHIEKEIQKPENSLSLLYRWQLLDPFVTVVCIDQKIRALREGRGLKFVKSKTIELDLKKNMISATKIADKVENQPLKSIACSGSRLNSSLPPICKSSSICTPVCSSLNHAPLVCESVSTVVEPDVIESSCNQKVDDESFPNSDIQVHRDFKPKHGLGGVNRKLFCCEEVCRRSLKSLARNIGKGSHVATGFHGMKSKVSESHPRERDTPSGVSSFNGTVSTLTKPDWFLSNASLPLGSTISHLRTSKSQNLKPDEVAFTKKSINCTVQDNEVPSDPNGKLLIGNQPCEETAIDQQLFVLRPKGKIISHERAESSKQGVLAHEKTLETIEEIVELERPDSSVSQEHRNREVFCHILDDTIRGAKSSTVHQEKASIHVLEGGLKKRMPESVVASGDNGKLFLANQTSDHLSEEQKVLFLYPQEGTLCFSMDKNCSQQQFACGNPMDAANGVTTHREVQSSVYQASLIKGVLVFGISSNIIHNLDFPLRQEDPNSVHHEDSKLADKKTAANILLQPEHLEKDTGSDIEASKSGVDYTSATMPVIKKVCKRSKKISEIEATKSHSEDVKTNLPCETNCGTFFLGANYKMSDHFDIPLYREGDSILGRESASDCLLRSENLGEQNGSALKAFEIVGHASKVPEICMTAKKLKKPEKSGTKAAKVNKKKKGNLTMPQMVESERTLLKMDRDHEDIAECQSENKERHRKSVTSKMSTSTRTSQHQYAMTSKTKKFPIQGSYFKESVLVAGSGKSPVRLPCGNDTGDASLLADDKPLDFKTSRKIAKTSKSKVHKENGRKRLQGCKIDDDDLLIAAIIKTKDFSSNSKHSVRKAGRSQSKGWGKLKSQKGSCKLLLRTPGKCGKHSSDGKRFLSGARTVLSWLLNSGAVSLKDIVQYRSPKNNVVVKDGWVTRDGILCKCCTKIFSVSEFKLHAGYKLHRPSLNLFLESGKSYTLCQLQAWSDEYKARRGSRRVAEVEEVDQNDDTCGLCGDGGELICCDNCPSTFHQVCLPTQYLPEGSWYCPNCTCKICGDAVIAKGPSCSLVMSECSQCKHKYHEICVKEKGVPNGELGSSTWFCGGNCQEVYFGLRSRVGVVNPIAKGFSWTILRCSHGDPKVHSAQKIALMAECNTKLAIALSIMEECFLPMVDPRTGIDMIPHVLYNWGSNFPRLNYQGFYTVILEKDDEVVSVALIRVHGVTVAEMPLIATCSEHRRQGMCRLLMSVIEEMLKSFKVEMLVLSAIPDLVDTWTSGFGFKPIHDDEKKWLSNINLMLFPGTTLLTKSLYEAKEINEPEDDIVLSSREDMTHKVKEQEDSQQENLPASFCRKPLSTLGHSEPGDITTEFCSATTEASNLYERDLYFSTEQALVAERASASVLGSGSVCSSSPALISELSTDPCSTVTGGEIRNIQSTITGNADNFTEDSVADGLRNKEWTPHYSQGGKVGDRRINETSKGKKFLSNFQIMIKEDPLNLNQLSMAELDSRSVSVDGSRSCENY